MFVYREDSVEAQQLNMSITDHQDRLISRPNRMGEVFTRRWVVNLILDLAGYTADRDLAGMRAVEPACGGGAFLEPMVERLVKSAETFGRDLSECPYAIQASDLRRENVERARKLAVNVLSGGGLSTPTAAALAEVWVDDNDFLLDTPGDLVADFVIGNPPYVRLEDVPPTLKVAYRQACPSMRGRSDLYVGFIERGLQVLRDGGTLAYIVADRWMHNQYGVGLRQLISDHFSVDLVLEMHDTDAFEEPVSAYPAITIVTRRPQGKTVLAKASKEFVSTSAPGFARWATRSARSVKTNRSYSGARLAGWFEGSGLWPSGDPQTVALVRSLESRLPPLQDPGTGTRVGIGVATGADKVFVSTDRTIAESDRLLPLVTSDDIVSGRVEWSGSLLVNPWTERGLVSLADYPRLAAYYSSHRETLERRHVAKTRPASWYRTIDRVTPRLLKQPKLLLPDIKASIHPVLEQGGLYPHHNLYYVVSETWDLEVLGGYLLSAFSNLFVGTYCVKMRGGCYRFEAQYLRKIRVPQAGAFDTRARRGLRAAFTSRDIEKATAISMRALGIEELPKLPRSGYA